MLHTHTSCSQHRKWNTSYVPLIPSPPVLHPVKLSHHSASAFSSMSLCWEKPLDIMTNVYLPFFASWIIQWAGWFSMQRIQFSLCGHRNEVIRKHFKWWLKTKCFDLLLQQQTSLILNGTIIYKMTIVLYWRRLETSYWNKLILKLLTQVIIQVRSRVIFS